MSAISASTTTANPLLINTTISPLTVLAQASQAAAEATIQREVQLVQNDLTNTYNAKITAAENSANPTPAQQAQQDQIDALNQQLSAINSIETQYGTNANIFSDLTTQLQNLQTAASNADSQKFDLALSQANTDLADLQVAGFNPLFQDDGVANLKLSGLGIQSSSSYNLSTSQGQAAALAAITQAQQLVSQSNEVTLLNQNEAGTQAVALNSSISSMTQTLQQLQVTQISQSTQEVANLQQQLQDQLNLIQLNLGQSTQQAQSLEQQAEAEQNLYAPPAPGTVLSIIV